MKRKKGGEKKMGVIPKYGIDKYGNWVLLNKKEVEKDKAKGMKCHICNRKMKKDKFSGMYICSYCNRF